MTTLVVILIMLQTLSIGLILYVHKQHWTLVDSFTKVTDKFIQHREETLSSFGVVDTQVASLRADHLEKLIVLQGKMENIVLENKCLTNELEHYRAEKDEIKRFDLEVD